MEHVGDAVTGQHVAQLMGARRLLLVDDPHRGQRRGGVMSPLLQQFADTPVESLVAPGPGSWQVGVDYPVRYGAQDGRGRLPVSHQGHGDAQAGRARTASRDHEYSLGGRLDAAGLGEDVRAVGRSHGGGGHDQRYRPPGISQVGQVAEGGCGRGLADDQVVLPVPAAQRGLQDSEAVGMVIEQEHCRLGHRATFVDVP